MPFSIPLRLRAFSFDTFSRPGTREFALKSYALAARLAAFSLSNVAFAERIELRGGSVPAISDIDLSVFLERNLTPEEWAEWVPPTRQHYLTLKALCPLLGEPLFFDPLSLSALNDVAPFLNLSLQQGRFLAGTEGAFHFPVPTLERRWPAVFHSYATALREWLLELQGRNRNFHRACVARSVHKARLALYGAAELTQAEGTSPQLLAALYRAIEMALGAQAETAGSETRTDGYLSLLWQTRLKSEFPDLIPSGAAFVLGTEVSAETLFRKFETVLKAHLSDSRFSEPPLLLPPKAHGLAWAQTETSRASVPADDGAAEAAVKSLHRKLVVQAVRLPADLTSVPVSIARRYVEAQRLDAGQLARLCPRAESLRPHLERAEDAFQLRESILRLKIWD